MVYLEWDSAYSIFSLDNECREKRGWPRVFWESSAFLAVSSSYCSPGCKFRLHHSDLSCQLGSSSKTTWTVSSVLKSSWCLLAIFFFNETLLRLKLYTKTIKFNPYFSFRSLSGSLYHDLKQKTKNLTLNE